MFNKNQTFERRSQDTERAWIIRVTYQQNFEHRNIEKKQDNTYLDYKSITLLKTLNFLSTNDEKTNKTINSGNQPFSFKQWITYSL